MTAAGVLIPSPTSSPSYAVTDDRGLEVGAVCHYPSRGVWTVTVGRRVCTVTAAVEAARLAAVLRAHPGVLCRAGLYVEVAAACTCRAVAEPKTARRAAPSLPERHLP